jgi:DnaJ-class molecular chaperone
MMPCPTCDGNEFVEMDPEDGVWPPQIFRTCRTCAGRGWVHDAHEPRTRGVPTYRPRR